MAVEPLGSSRFPDTKVGGDLEALRRSCLKFFEIAGAPAGVDNRVLMPAARAPVEHVVLDFRVFDGSTLPA